MLGAVGIFLYVGVEVGLASIAVNYFKTQGVDSAKTASFLVSLYWGGALIGRLAQQTSLAAIFLGDHLVDQRQAFEAFRVASVDVFTGDRERRQSKSQYEECPASEESYPPTHVVVVPFRKCRRVYFS